MVVQIRLFFYIYKMHIFIPVPVFCHFDLNFFSF